MWVAGGVRRRPGGAFLLEGLAGWRSCCRYEFVLVAAGMVALVGVVGTKTTAGVEVALPRTARRRGDGIGPGRAPYRAGDVGTIIDQAAAAALDDAGGDAGAVFPRDGASQVGDTGCAGGAGGVEVLGCLP